MAKNASRPGRRLIVFAILIAAMYGGIALEGVWTPKLGLDLQGGTRITLEASTSTGEEITPEKMEEARGIIDQRVNGQGVAEAEVAVQGNRNIVVEIPGERRTDLVDDVSQTAQLRYSRVSSRRSCWSWGEDSSSTCSRAGASARSAGEGGAPWCQAPPTRACRRSITQTIALRKGPKRIASTASARRGAAPFGWRPLWMATTTRTAGKRTVFSTVSGIPAPAAIRSAVGSVGVCFPPS